MTTFAYTALEPSGKKRTGFVEAPDKKSAIAKVTAEGRFVVEIREEKDSAAVASSKSVAGKVEKKQGKANRSEVALFTRRMADLSEAGLPLDRVLQVLGEQSEYQQLSDAAFGALEDVKGGLPVSDALGKYPKLFPSVYTMTLAAGEASGQFPQATTRLANLLENEVARRSKIISALVYPAVLTATAVGVVIFLITFVVPRLSGVFKDMGDDLPLPTKVLLALTDALTNNWLIIIIGLVALVVGFRVWSSTPAGAYKRDQFFMHAPVFGKIVQKAVISRYARVLGTLVFGGVPILDALRLAGLAAGNRVFIDNSVQVEQDVRDGVPIAQAMKDTGVFPPVLTHMIAIGEETGNLPKMLERVSESLDFEVETGLGRLTAMMEPIIVLVMGAFVAFVVLSVMLPIFQAQSLVK